MNSHEIYMLRCIELAKKGIGSVAPNPMVGCVIVHENKIIGEGYHQKYGEAHAEVNAILNVKDKSLLTSSTLYVNLEPCAHFGKTPPCADLIVEYKIPKVVIANVDPHSKVAGKGIEKLKNAGIEVITGVCEHEGNELNKRFFKYHRSSKPYVILKWAQSKDGFIDIIREKNEKGIVWISQAETKKLVHKWRSEEAAILVGKNTISTDNPHLTVREFIGKDPSRIVIDQQLRLDYTAFHVGDGKVQTLIVTEKVATGFSHLKFIHPLSFSLDDILRKIAEENFQSVLVEGGKHTLEKFIEENEWNEIRVIEGVTELNKGVRAPVFQGKLISNEKFGLDTIKIYLNA